MQLHWLDFVVIGLYLVGMFIVGLICLRLVKSQKDYFLGGRKFGKFMLTFQSFGIGTHSEDVVAVVGQCYRVGLAGIWWQFMWLFATPIYWLSHPMLRRMRMTTTADYWKERFSPGLANMAAVFGLFQVTFTIATMLKGISVVLDSVTLGAFPPNIAIPVCAVLFVAYGIAGGLYAATITDLFQGVLTLTLSLLLIPFILIKVGGMTGLHELVSPDKFSYTVPGEMTVFFILMISLNSLVGIYTGPHTMTNLGSGRNEWDVRIGVMAGTMLKRFCTVAWAFIGIGALAIYPSLPDHEHAFGYLIRDLLPAGLTGLMIAATLAAIMSTCDALMLSGAALFTRNLYSKMERNKSERHYLQVGRYASIAIVLAACVFAFMLPGVLAGLKKVWAVYAFMGLAWWGGVLWKRTTTAAAWTSTVVTAGTYITTEIYNRFAAVENRLAYPEQIAIYLSAGFIALVLVSLFTTQSNPEAVRRFYRKMRTPTTVRSEFDADEDDSPKRETVFQKEPAEGTESTQ